ncbi:MAG: galactose oxidase-like domain-containing protein, partial [Pseudomonadales bacterium]
MPAQKNLFGRKCLSIAVLCTVSLVSAVAHGAPDDPGEGGAWSSVQGWPMIPVSAANLPDGRIVAWASNERTAFPAGPEFTYTAIWDPQSNEFTEIPHPTHDMFCSHHVMMEDGKVFVSGGRNQGNSPWTSTFNPETNEWEVLPNMNRGRWYPTSVMTADGKVMTSIGSGGGNTAEIWDGSSWSLMGGLNFDGPILNYNHGERNWWPIMHLAPDGRIFHSGPTPAMHMIDPTGNGSMQQTNTHSDWYPKHGTTVMYDEGKLLTAGGWTNGSTLASSARSMTIDLNGPAPVITEIAPMLNARKFHNGVTLPNGEVLVVGGNTSGAKFNDSGSVFAVELWNPETGTWREGASMSVPRNYHSIALLMLDGRVLAGGGGLCNCAADHQDSQIYSPPYLFNADGSPAARPVITRVPAVVEVAETLSVSASPNLDGFSIVKMSSTTHAMNTDLRYLPLGSFENTAGEYSVTLPGNPNVLTPGYWMLFALNAQGTPSVAKVIQVSTQGTVTGPPRIKQMAALSNLQNTAVDLALVISDPDGDA